MKNVNNLLNIILSPSKTCRQIDEHPTWLLPFLIVSAGTTLLAWLNLPLIEKIVLSSLSVDVPHEQVKRIYTIGQTVAVFSTPVSILINWLFSSSLLWATAYLFEERAPFKKMFSLVGHCSIISFLGVFLSWVILRLRGIDTVSTLKDLDVSLGVTLMFGESDLSAPVRVFLSHLNIVSAWYWIVVGLGLFIILGCSKRKAVIVTGSVWGLSILFSVVVTTIGEMIKKSGFPM
jgi:hypothetical protein